MIYPKLKLEMNEALTTHNYNKYRVLERVLLIAKSKSKYKKEKDISDNIFKSAFLIKKNELEKLYSYLKYCNFEYKNDIKKQIEEITRFIKLYVR